MNRINQLIDMEYKEELEKLHARDREDTGFSEVRIKELEAQFEAKKKIALEEFQQKAIRAVQKQQLAAQMQRKREEAIAKLRFTERIPIWNSGGHVNSSRGFEMSCQTHVEQRETLQKQMKTNGEELLCVTCNDCALCDPCRHAGNKQRQVTAGQ